MNLLKRFFSSGSSAPQSTTEMKTINYRGGVVQFRIPCSWREEYSDDDGGMFYDDKRDSGTLRLTVMTLESPSEITSESATTVLNTLRSVQGRAVRQANGNALARCDESAVERGQRIKLFYWFVASALPPKHARIATFSYTILHRNESSEGTARDLHMLEKEIPDARFSSELGILVSE